jgi:nitrile hydratase accessory protein
MERHTNPKIAEMQGPSSLPRRSGELVFHDPWERKVFAMAVALCEQGFFTWDEFRDHLIAEIAETERAAGLKTLTSALPSYYESWLAAFENLLREKGIPLPEI